MTEEILSFLHWQANLDPRLIYSQPPAPQYPALYNDQLYYLEQRAAEGGRSVLVRLHVDSTADVVSDTLTPDGFNIRSRAHEYGGKAFLLAQGHVWFNNDTDGRIYKQKLCLNARPEALSAVDNTGYAIDFQLTANADFMILVQEHPLEGAENENCISFLPLNAVSNGIPEKLLSGADFYATPVLSPDGTRISWIEWNHPQMPWDGSLLKTGLLQAECGRLSVDQSSVITIAGGTGCAVNQLQYSPAGVLFFALDGRDEVQGVQADSWNLFCWDGQSVTLITDDDGEFGEAHWIFGQQRYTVLNEEKIIAIRTMAGRDQLVEIDTSTSTISIVANEVTTSLAQVSGHGGNIALYTASSFTSPTAVHAYLTESNEIREWISAEPLTDTADISIPRHLQYATSDGDTSHAWYYAPKNHHYKAPEGESPPLLVMVHGGPTARCDSALNYQRQYWTGRGYAVLDVNHRGSTGYGRAYRQSLQGQWGLIDSMDVADAVKYTVAQGLAHPQQVCIRGGSAGGYVVLRALTLFPDLFCAGACYYGIGNLVTLMEFTHKFEAHYLDGLLGEPYHGQKSDQPGSAYYDRSPIHDLALLKSPMIVFQGLDDKVVPPELSRELIDHLEARGVYHQYVEYPGEGHGFRKLETRIDSLQREAAFFSEVISGNGEVQ